MPTWKHLLLSLAGQAHGERQLDMAAGSMSLAVLKATPPSVIQFKRFSIARTLRENFILRVSFP
jgi:hypothetical protein